MRTLASVLLLVGAPFAATPAQSMIGTTGGALDVGWARLADTSALEINMRGWWGRYATGVHVDVAAGVDWEIKHRFALDMMDLDVAQFIGFRPEPRTLVVLRGGLSAWSHNDRTDGGGLNVGLGVHHWFRASTGLTVDVIWRQFDFAAPSLTVGYAVR